MRDAHGRQVDTSDPFTYAHRIVGPPAFPRPSAPGVIDGLTMTTRRCDGHYHATATASTLRMGDGATRPYAVPSDHVVRTVLVNCGDRPDLVSLLTALAAGFSVAFDDEDPDGAVIVDLYTRDGTFSVRPRLAEDGLF